MVTAALYPLFDMHLSGALLLWGVFRVRGTETGLLLKIPKRLEA